MKNIFKEKISKKPIFYLLAAALIIYFAFGLYHLTKFETADEHYWMYSNYNNNDYWENNDGRVHQYWEALFSGDWKKTRVDSKPGITVTYVSGIGSWLKTSLDKNIEKGIMSNLTKSDKAQIINLYFRIPILVFNGLFAIFLFYLIRKLTQNNWIALLSTACILLSPIIIGISQIVNPDALLWEFGFASLVSLLIYLRDGQKKFAVFSSIFLGLALLTKYSSVIFLPFFLAVIFFHLFRNVKLLPEGEIHKHIKKISLAYYLIIAGALAIYAVLLPDNLIEFRHFMKGSLGFKGMQLFFWTLFSVNLFLLLDAYLFQSIFFKWIFKKFFAFENILETIILALFPIIFIIVIINGFLGSDWLGLFAIPFDSSANAAFSHLSLDKTLRVILIQFMPLIFSLTPIVIFGALYAWIKNLKSESESRWIIFVFSFFIVIFVTASFQQELLLTNRYGILLYPFVFTIAAIGIFQMLNRLFNANAWRGTGLFFLVILISLFSLWQIKPFYFNYMNFLLPQQYLVSDAWGYGGYEAAQYLNRLPDAKNIRIWSDYNGLCLFFNGRCDANYLTMKNIQKKSLDGLPRFDYFIETRRGSILSKNIWDDLKIQYESREIWNLNINGRPANFVKIYENQIYKK